MTRQVQLVFAALVIVLKAVSNSGDLSSGRPSGRRLLTRSQLISFSYCGIVAAVSLALLPASSPAALIPLAKWTFETSMPTSAGPHAAEEGIGSATIIQNSGVSTYSSPTGNGSAHSFSSDGWDGGGHYYFDWSSPTPVSAVGTVFRFDQASSDRGPDNLDVYVSYNGGPYLNILVGAAMSDIPPNPAWNPTTRDLRYTLNLAKVGNPPLLTSLSYRISFSGLDSIGGGPVLPSANVRIDNVSIEYDDPTVPEPSAFALTAICFAAIPAVRRAR